MRTNDRTGRTDDQGGTGPRAGGSEAATGPGAGAGAEGESVWRFGLRDTGGCLPVVWNASGPDTEPDRSYLTLIAAGTGFRWKRIHRRFPAGVRITIAIIE